MSRSGRRNRQQCNIVLIIKVKKTKERSVMEAAVNIGKIDLFAPLAFGQSSHRSGGTTPPPPAHLRDARRAAVATTAGTRWATTAMRTMMGTMAEGMVTVGAKD